MSTGIPMRFSWNLSKLLSGGVMSGGVFRSLWLLVAALRSMIFPGDVFMLLKTLYNFSKTFGVLNWNLFCFNKNFIRGL